MPNHPQVNQYINLPTQFQIILYFSTIQVKSHHSDPDLLLALYLICRNLTLYQYSITASIALYQTNNNLWALIIQFHLTHFIWIIIILLNIFLLN